MGNSTTAILVCCLSWMVISVIGAETIKSLEDLQNVLEFVKTSGLRSHLASYIEAQKRRLSYLHKALDEIQKQKKLLAHPDFRIDHPVTAYKFIRLQSSIVRKVERHIHIDPITAFNRTLLEEVIERLPTKKEMEKLAEDKKQN